MSEPVMPTAIVNWIQSRNWGMHHLEWHLTRLWDAVPAARQFAQAQGWARAAEQEGAAGNGLAFLAMHRVMIRSLVAAFPTQAGLFRGWLSPPTNPNDPADTVPAASPLPGPFNPDMLAAIARVGTSAALFSDDDALGRYLETSRRPSPGNPQGVSSDRTTGVHNYFHVRFTDATSPINVGDPQVNLLNQRFWRLHGWIDARWTAFRQAKGLPETEPTYQAALREAEHHMGLHMMPVASPAMAGAAPSVFVPPVLANEFFSWGGQDRPADNAALTTPQVPAAALPAGAGDPDDRPPLPTPAGALVPTWDGDPGQNNGVRHLFRPIDINHMKSEVVAGMVGRIYALDDYDDVRGNAVKIYGMVRTKQMPPNAPWSDDQLLRFKTWMDNGFPR